MESWIGRTNGVFCCGYNAPTVLSVQGAWHDTHYGLQFGIHTICLCYLHHACSTWLLDMTSYWHFGIKYDSSMMNYWCITGNNIPLSNSTKRTDLTLNIMEISHVPDILKSYLACKTNVTLGLIFSRCFL
jgi:hypothetical protein